MQHSAGFISAESLCINKTCTVLHQVGVSFDLYRIIILLVVLYECETWSFTLREEVRLTVYENRVLRRIFGSKRNEVTGE